MEYEGLENVITESKDLNGPYGLWKLDVFLDTGTNRVWSRVCIGNNLIVYHDPNIICVGRICYPLTTEQLIEIITNAEKKRYLEDVC